MARELVSFSGGSLDHDTASVGDQVCEIRLKLPTDSQISVLAIDDNPDTLRLLQRCAADTRCRLHGVSDTARSLALAEETLPEIILLDVLLQDMDGWQLLGRFRAHPRLGGRPVIVCTILPQRDLALSPGAAPLGKTTGVAQEVEQNQPDADAIANQLRQIKRDIAAQGQALGVEERLNSRNPTISLSAARSFIKVICPASIWLRSRTSSIRLDRRWLLRSTISRSANKDWVMLGP